MASSLNGQHAEWSTGETGRHHPLLRKRSFGERVCEDRVSSDDTFLSSQLVILLKRFIPPLRHGFPEGAFKTGIRVFLQLDIEKVRLPVRIDAHDRFTSLLAHP